MMVGSIPLLSTQNSQDVVSTDPKPDDEDEEEYFPMENFSLVSKGVYRGAFPMKKNFGFLKRIGLRSILTLIMEGYPDANLDFCRANKIKLIQVAVEGNKEPFKDIAEKDIRRAMRHLLDPQNHPILIHCNKGKHRTGCIVGCLRKVQGWAHSSICDEYIRFAQPKARIVDQRCIELFDPDAIYDDDGCDDYGDVDGPINTCKNGEGCDTNCTPNNNNSGSNQNNILMRKSNEAEVPLLKSTLI
eukprot:CAMPEP_0194570786 /NCGR_PEP_ID=MMETSP0292-20121207/7974_1 /TAXON_ID=39354 /ORGANISM="Heterosigma akashiwo, Strain CCMP2393" /LENGTH=243 /DNA_ID=CAMNT_0039421329 /DNA_START=215 /DNA_END=946 /DNA_ORIENTATION=-